MDWDKTYDKAIDRRNQEASYLFSRVNFFLTATAFLIAGLFALLGTGHCCHAYHNLSYFICIAGIVLSAGFLIMDHHNTVIIGKIDDYIIQLEELHQRGDSPKVGPIEELRNICKESRMEWRPNWVAPHALAVPAGFAVVWVVVLWFISQSYPWLFVGMGTLLVCVVVYVLWCLANQCWLGYHQHLRP